MFQPLVAKAITLTITSPECTKHQYTQGHTAYTLKIKFYLANTRNHYEGHHYNLLSTQHDHLIYFKNFLTLSLNIHNYR
jgi:hypothetical protein